MNFYALAERALRMEEEGRTIVRLNIGNTNLPAPAAAVERAVAALRADRSGYGSAAGLPRLRRLIAEREGCGPESVVIGPGSKLLIWGLLSVLCDRGDVVATPSPYWPAYALAGASQRLRLLPLPTRFEDGWSFDAARVPDARLFILCNPNNPTGAVYGDDLVREIVRRCRSRGVQVIIDEAYKGLAFEPISRADETIRVRSFSKEFSLEQWRLGYAVAPAAVAERLISFVAQTASCVPGFIQEAGIACLESDEAIRAPREELWRSRSRTLQRELTGSGFRFTPPGSGMYVFATRRDIIDSEAFCLDRLERTGVALAPGSSFGGYDRFVRISANQPEDVLEKAVAAID